MKIFIILYSISLFLLVSFQMTIAQVSTATTEWAKQYAGTGGSSDNANFLVLDDSGYIYVTGNSVGSGSGFDIVTIKYNSNGDSLWVRRYNGSANGVDEGNIIAIDNIGNIYVAGLSANTGTGTSDLTILKYSSNGVQLWVRNYNGPGNSSDGAKSIAFDSQNNVYVTGLSVGNGTGNDFVTLKYNTSGSLQWSRRYNGPGNGADQANGIKVDNSDNVYITGSSAGIGTGLDYATIKYNTLGDSLWVKRHNGTANTTDEALSLDLDISGNVFVTGACNYTGAGNDYTTIKYNPNGDSMWVRRYNGPSNGTDQARSIKVDNLGNSYITGNSSNDFATVKYNSLGGQVWSERYDGGGTEIAYYLIHDSLNNVYVTGQTGNNFLTVKYNSAGVRQWVQTYHSSYEYSYCVAIDRLRNVYVCGYRSAGQFSSANYLIVKYSQQTAIKLLIEGLYDPLSNQMLRDTVRVYLRSIVPPYDTVDFSYKQYLDTGATGYFRFHNPPYGEYYIQVKHRNSVETWSRANFTFRTMNFDFTTAETQAYGRNLVRVDDSPVRFAIYSGDVNQDATVDVVDMSITDNAAFAGLGGYILPDLNGDFFVDLSDLVIVDNNAINFVGVVKP